uniref:Protein kinase domain-containing protein n=1 Tax=Globodera pallida TaxID=36090 RepID=A0A183CAK9_GLOPA
MDTRNFHEKSSTDEHSTFVARFVNKNVVYSKKSEEWHTKQIEQIIEEYSYKALMALTRDERNRKMEVLMMAVFLREFYKSILPQNPDETQKKEDAESDLIDLISQRDERNAALKKAKQNLKKAENSYQRARKMAKKMLAYLDEVRAQPDMTFRKVLEKMRDQCARTENDADAHFFNAAFLKWMDITLAMNVTNLPNYVTEEGKVRPAETDMERMLAVVQLEARRDFQKRGREMAKKVFVYLDEVRAQPDMPFRKVLEKLDAKCARTENDADAHFFNAAFKKWMDITLTSNLTNLPNYVTKEGNVRQAETRMERMLTVVQLEARREFQKVANRFLPQYLLLTKAMTEHEVRECARQINWFHAVNVMIDPLQVNSNGTWLKNEGLRVGGFRSKSTTWLRTVPGLASGTLGPQRCQKGIATQFESNEAGASFHTEASQISAAAVATGDESESARYCSWALGDTTASDMHDMDSDVMAGGRAHSTEIASSDEIISSSDEKYQDDLKQPNYDSGSRSSRQNSFERQQSLSSQRDKRPLLGQLSDLPSEAVSISSPQHTLSDSSSQYSLSSTKSTVRAPVRPAPTIPRHRGSDTDTSVDNAKKIGKSVAGGGSGRSATLKKKVSSARTPRH